MRTPAPPESRVSVRESGCVPRDNSNAPIPISRTRRDAVAIRAKQMAQKLALAAAPVIESALRGGEGSLSPLPRLITISRAGYRDETIDIVFTVRRGR
jgi:hypothetical protein